MYRYIRNILYGKKERQIKIKENIKEPVVNFNILIMLKLYKLLRI